MENVKKSEVSKDSRSSFGCFGVAVLIMICLWVFLSPYLPESLGALIPLTVIFFLFSFIFLFSGKTRTSSFTGTLKSAEDYIKRGSEKYISKNDDAGAIEDYTKAIELDPHSIDAYFFRGVAKDSLEDLNGALADFNKAIELDPDSEESAYCNRGIVKNKLHEFKDAIADFTKAVELNPEDTEAYFERGVAKDELHDYNGAIADFTKAIELDPEYKEAYYSRGEAKNKLHDLTGAQDDFAKAAEITPEHFISEDRDVVENDELLDKKEAVPEMTRQQYQVTYAQNKTITAKDDLSDKKKTITDFTRPDYDVSYSKRRSIKWIVLALIALLCVAVGIFLKVKENKAKQPVEEGSIQQQPSDEGARFSNNDFRGVIQSLTKAIELDS